MPNLTLTQKWSDGGVPITATRQLTPAAEASLDFSVPNGSHNLAGTFSLVTAKVQNVFILSNQAVTLSAGGTNAIQTITTTGTVTAGTFTLTFGGQTTAALPYTATASQIQTALLALSSIGTGNVSCAGGPLPGTGVTVTFTGSLGVAVRTLMTHTDTLTGGSVSIATTTAGAAPDTTFSLLAGLPLLWDYQGYYAQPFLADVVRFNGTNVSGVDALVQVRTFSSL
jgi:hypothetical protein